MFLNNQQVTEEIKREIKKKSRNKWQWKHDNSKPVGCSKSSSKREIYSNTILSQETRKHRIDSLSLHLKQLEKEDKKPQISRRKEIIKIWAEINEKEMKETIVKINKTKSWFFEKINNVDKPLARLIKKKKRRMKSQNYKWKRRVYNRQCRNTNKTPLRKTIQQENG